MNFQEQINAFMAQDRANRLSTSSQLMLGELIIKLEGMPKEKEIVFDFGMRPAGACSRRGSYCEFAIEYSDDGGGSAIWNTEEIEESYEWGNVYKRDEYVLPNKPKVGDLLGMFKALLNKSMTGYKGGEYKMHKNVAVYIGNYGESGISGYKGQDYPSVAVYNINDNGEHVVIQTDISYQY